MSKTTIMYLVLLTIAGCGIIQIGEPPGKQQEIKTTHYENGQKKSEQDPNRGTYTEWYEDGQMKFLASKWYGRREDVWIPVGKNGRIMFRLIESFGVDGRYNFMYDEKSQGQVPWGAYNLYEAWYPDGKKKFVYKYPYKQFTEWNEEGSIIIGKN